MDQRVRIKRVIEALNPRIFDEEKPLKVRGIAHLGMGWMHDNFLVTVNDRRLIFRISLLKGNKFAPGLKRAKEHITSEYNNTRRLQESGIAPKVYYKNISCREIDRPFLIIDYLEGKRIKRLSRKDIRRLALLLAKLHSMDRIPGLRNSNFDEAFLDWNRQRVERIANEEEYARFTNEGFKHELKKAYSRARGIRFNPIKPSIIHGDPAGENLLRVKEGVRLIDWEGVALGPPQRDIATVIDK
jgi:thiamine kinase-like enzyme